jgi:3',5'-cyclic AMP phosphodiesterase CpdA
MRLATLILIAAPAMAGDPWAERYSIVDLHLTPDGDHRVHIDLHMRLSTAEDGQTPIEAVLVGVRWDMFHLRPSEVRYVENMLEPADGWGVEPGTGDYFLYDGLAGGRLLPVEPVYMETGDWLRVGSYYWLDPDDTPGIDDWAETTVEVAVRRINYSYWPDEPQYYVLSRGFSYDAVLTREAPVLVADCNCDGVVNGYDVDPFVAVLTGELTDDCSVAAADCNGDGAVDGLDVAPFVAAVTGEQE